MFTNQTLSKLLRGQPQPQPNQSSQTRHLGPSQLDRKQQLRSSENRNSDAESINQITFDQEIIVGDEGDENSNGEISMLKKQVQRIESIATQEMNVLRNELKQRDSEISQLMDYISTLKDQLTSMQKGGNCKEIEGVEVGINTEADNQEEEIRSLKEALVRHIRISRDLTAKMSPQSRCIENPQVPRSRNASTHLTGGKLTMEDVVQNITL